MDKRGAFRLPAIPRHRHDFNRLIVFTLRRISLLLHFCIIRESINPPAEDARNALSTPGFFFPRFRTDSEFDTEPLITEQ